MKLIRILIGLTIGVLLVLGILELALRIAGSCIEQEIYKNAYRVDDATDIILCIGDSHTQGIGAQKNFDYPNQLQSLLNQRSTNKKYRAVNLGQAGFNSSQAVERGCQYIKQLQKTAKQPSIVIFNAGRNNNHNFTKASFLPEELRKLNSKKATITYLFANSRAFRLGQVATSRLEFILENHKHPEEWPDFAYSPLVSMGEMKFFENWMKKDLDFLNKQVESIGAKLVLLNYWVGVTPWVDRSFQKFSKENPVFFVDVRRFGGSLLTIPANTEFLVAEDGHPNEAGYGRIAELVFAALEENHLINEIKKKEEIHTNR